LLLLVESWRLPVHLRTHPLSGDCSGAGSLEEEEREEEKEEEEEEEERRVTRWARGKICW
jgi:hypothetical protein